MPLYLEMVGLCCECCKKQDDVVLRLGRSKLLDSHPEQNDMIEGWNRGTL